MKTIPLLGLFLIATNVYPLAIGEPMPKMQDKLKNVDEKEFSLDQLSGKKGTLLIFTCNHCPWAKAWEERITSLGNTYRGKEVGVAMINSNDDVAVPDDSLPNMVTRAKKLGLQFPYVMDTTSNVAKSFGATRTPEAFLFDAKGKLVYHGAIDDNAEKPEKVTKTYLKNSLDALVTGKPITESETKAIGCSIKFRK